MAKNENKNEACVKMALSLKDDEAQRVSEVQKKALTEELESFPPVKEGNVNVCGVYAFDMGELIEVKVFIRNGMNKALTLGEVPFMILDKDGEVIAYQVFNLRQLGSIPPYCARPWKLNFEKKNVLVSSIPQEGWKIGFDNRVNTMEYVNIEFEKLPEYISEDNKVILKDFLSKLPKMEPGEVSASRFSMGIDEEGEILISLIVRNARNNPVELGKLPVTAKDANGNTAFTAEFDLNKLVIGANKAQLVNLIYKTSITMKEDVDLSGWSLTFGI